MSLARLALILPLALVVSACAAHKPMAPTFNQKMLDEQRKKIAAGEDVYGEKPDEITSNTRHSSLWAKSVGSPYIIRNQKAAKVGDLLTILISESATASTKASTDATRESEVELDASVETGQGALSQRLGVGLDNEFTNDFKGEGTTDRSGTFEATVQAVVEDVLPNGTLFVRGRKVITINNEDQEVEITGFVRPDDIRINNTVVSNMIADAEISYYGQGIISDKQRGGWGSRLLDFVWPF